MKNDTMNVGLNGVNCFVCLFLLLFDEDCGQRQRSGHRGQRLVCLGKKFRQRTTSDGQQRKMSSLVLNYDKMIFVPQFCDIFE